LNLDDFRGVDAFQDKLGDAVALLDLEVGLVVVEKQDLDLAAVIGVNDTCAGIDEVLGSET
jgi:hypothetical protein